MTQTTGATSFRNTWEQISTQGGTGTWLDISGYTNEIQLSGGERGVGEVATADGDYPIVTPGKRNAEVAKVKVIYTEEAAATGAYETLRGYHEGGSPVYFRYAPKGSAAGSFLFTSGAGYLEYVRRPSGPVNDPNALLVEFSLKAPSFTKGTI